MTLQMTVIDDYTDESAHSFTDDKTDDFTNDRAEDLWITSPVTVFDYSCCDTHVVVGILDDQHDGTVHPLHVAVQGLQGEAVLLGAVD